jgi:hypothetical protein
MPYYKTLIHRELTYRADSAEAAAGLAVEELNDNLQADLESVQGRKSLKGLNMDVTETSAHEIWRSARR